jgi:hypothetical protein
MAGGSDDDGARARLASTAELMEAFAVPGHGVRNDERWDEAEEPAANLVAFGTTERAKLAPSQAGSGRVSALTKSSSWSVRQHSNAVQCFSYAEITLSP